jgi:hypothetical protein
MQKIHNSTLVVTLSAKSPDATVTGTIDAYGPVGAYTVYYEDARMKVTIDAALIGPAARHFTIQNAGTIIANGDGELGFGVVLGTAGTLANTGTIVSGTGIAILGAAPGGYIKNSKLIEGSVAAGIYLQAAGTALNAAPGTITGEVNGVDLYAGGSIYNAGLITAGDSAIYLHHGGAIYNYGTIATARNGVFAASGQTDVYNGAAGHIIAPLNRGNGLFLGSGSVTNAGVIQGYDGIQFTGAGAVTNFGTITAGKSAIYLTSAGSVTNHGTIHGANYGIDLLTGGGIENTGSIDGGSAGIYVFSGPETIVNAATGRITGYETGLKLNLVAGTAENAGYVHGFVGVYGGGTIINHGVISGTRAAIDLFAGTIINTGKMIGTDSGIFAARGGTIIDSGGISAGAGDAIYFGPGVSSRLVLTPSAKITGTVDLNGGILELAWGTKTGSIALGRQYETVGAITLDSHALWDLSAAAAIAAGVTLTNNGTIRETNTDSLTIAGPLAGAGVIDLGKRPLTLNGAVARGQTIAFTGTGDLIDLGDPAAFAGKIAAFSAGETIDLTGIAFGNVEATSFSAGVLTLASTGGSYTITFAGAGIFGAATLATFADGTGTGITLSAKARMGFLTPPSLPPSTLTIADFFTAQPAAPSHPPTPDAPSWASPSILTPHPHHFIPILTLHA